MASKTIMLEEKDSSVNNYDESKYVVYYVDNGDILENVADRFNMALNILMKINNLFKDSLSFNQKLLVKKPDMIEMKTLKEHFNERNYDPSEIEMTSYIMNRDKDLKLIMHDDPEDVEWEIINSINTKEILKTRMDDLYLYEELQEIQSGILDKTKLYEISKHLPPETVGADWHLVYSTARDGWSLSTLYRKVASSTRSCCLLIIEDSNAMIFGALCNTHIRIERSFYGNWLTFIFRWNPNFEKFTYSQKYGYFLYGHKDFFSIGCPRSAIRIENTLFCGSSRACETFNSPPLVDSEYFDISSLEVWTFY